MGDDRALWDELNDQQAEMWLKAGRKVTPEIQKIIDRMRPLTPPGYGDRPLAGLKKAAKS